MLTSQEINDRRNARIGLYLPIRLADVPDPGRLTAWRRILSDNTSDPQLVLRPQCVSSVVRFRDGFQHAFGVPGAGSDNPAGIYMFAPTPGPGDPRLFNTSQIRLESP